MDRFKQNPFLGLLAVLTIGALAAAGYFFFQSHSRYQAAAQEFADLGTTLQRLQGNTPFPNEQNVRLMREELDAARATLEDIGRSLEVDAPATTPQAFQDQLRQQVNEITARAAASGVTLGEGFYLGFQDYETQPPPAAAAAQLAHQLRSISTVAGLLVEAKVQEISAITRSALPTEAPGGAPAGESPGGHEQTAGDKEGSLPDLVLAPFDITFVAEQAALRAALNRILEVEPPVFIRLVAITNSATSAPAKGAGTVEAADDEAKTIKPVLGQETLLVNLRLAAIAAGPAGTP